MGVFSFGQGYAGHHHHCDDGHHHHHHCDEGVCVAEASIRIPELRYQKDPVMVIEDLYRVYPLGGQPGWYAFVISQNCFAYWEMRENKWSPLKMPLETLLECMGFESYDDLNENSLVCWDGSKFESVAVFETEEW